MPSPPFFRRPCRWVLAWAWRRHLRRLATNLQALQPRWWLLHSLHRWQGAVWESQADDGRVCHRALQLPRAFAAWQDLVRRLAAQRQQAELCWRTLQRGRQRAALEWWHAWAAAKAARQAKLEAAAAWAASRSRRSALLAWCAAAAGKATRRRQQQAAAAHHACQLQQRPFRAWRRWACVRRMGGRWRQLNLLRCAFGGWRWRAQHQATKTERWRLAVRHRYLRQLWAAWSAWQQHCQQRQLKAQRLEAMRRHRHCTLLRACLAAWAGPFLAAARAGKAQLRLADSHRSSRLLRGALAAWRGPFLAGARRRRQRKLTAECHHTAWLMRSAWLHWHAWLARRAEKQEQLEAARALLRPGRLRRALLAFRRGCAAAALQRHQVGRSEGEMGGQLGLL